MSWLVQQCTGEYYYYLHDHGATWKWGNKDRATRFDRHDAATLAMEHQILHDQEWVKNINQPRWIYEVVLAPDSYRVEEYKRVIDTNA
jgi:hypothetical protein